MGDWELVQIGGRALTGAGLVMADWAAVSAPAARDERSPVLATAEQAEAWARCVSFVHGETDSAIGLRIGHAGPRGTGRALAASQAPGCDVVSDSDMAEVCELFARAAAFADRAGFDLIELDLAEGHLLADFLSSQSNRREDDYGGPLASRQRFPLKVVEAVRSAWPSDKPVAARLGAREGSGPGLSADEAVVVAAELSRRGMRSGHCDTVGWGAPRASICRRASQ